MQFDMELDFDLTRASVVSEGTLREELHTLSGKLADVLNDQAGTKPVPADLVPWLHAMLTMVTQPAAVKADTKPVAPKAPKATPKPSKQISTRAEVDAGLAAAMF